MSLFTNGVNVYTHNYEAQSHKPVRSVETPVAYSPREATASEPPRSTS